MITLGLFPPEEGGRHIHLDKNSLEKIVMALARLGYAEFGGTDKILVADFARINFDAHRISRGLNGPFKSIDLRIRDFKLHVS